MFDEEQYRVLALREGDEAPVIDVPIKPGVYLPAPLVPIGDALKDEREHAALLAAAKEARNTAAIAGTIGLLLERRRDVGLALIALREGGALVSRGGDRRSKFRAGTLKLADLGIPRKDAARWQRYAQMDPMTWEAFKVGIVSEALAVIEGGRFWRQHALHGSEEWGTPWWLVDAVCDVFGGRPGLDPATSPIAQARIKALRFFIAEDNALTQSWDCETCFVNPPFTPAKIRRFVSKLVDSIESGAIREQALLVTPNGTETQWFQLGAGACTAMCLTNRRMAFLDSSGNPVRGNPQGNVIFHFGQHSERFIARLRQCDEIGVIFRPAR